jgi:hypothetical protein
VCGGFHRSMRLFKLWLGESRRFRETDFPRPIRGRWKVSLWSDFPNFGAWKVSGKSLGRCLFFIVWAVVCGR